MCPKVAREFDDVLQLVVLGVKHLCHRTLAYAIRRMRGEQSKEAWAALDSQDAEESAMSTNQSVPPLETASTSTSQAVGSGGRVVRKGKKSKMGNSQVLM